jgi:hypothetical protein
VLRAEAKPGRTVHGVEFLVDGAVVGTEDTTAPFTASIDTRTLSNGSHTVVARGREDAGTVATAPVSFTVQNAPPPGANLVQNPSVEVASATPGLPAGWRTGRYGNNTATFTYPVAGLQGQRGVRIDVSAYTDGQARWYFPEVAVSPGDSLVFTDYYRASVPTGVWARFTLDDGTFVYPELGTLPASNEWTRARFSFSAPAHAVSVTILHSLGAVGWLVSDAYALQKGTLPGPRTSTAGLFRPSSGFWYLKNYNGGGEPDLMFPFGADGDRPLVGDWDGDGVETIGVYRPSKAKWFLRNTNSAGEVDVRIEYGATEDDRPVVGDWDGDGVDTIGVYRSSTGAFYLRNANGAGNPDLVFYLGGAPGDVPVAGDWNGDGIDTVGIYRPGEMAWYLKTGNRQEASFDVRFFGAGAIDLPIVGDWNADGRDSIGVFRTSNTAWFLRNDDTGGTYPRFFYGDTSDIAVAGTWVH